MIRKQSLISQIKTAMDVEKRLIPLFNKHISSSLNFSQLKNKDKDSIIEQFQGFSLMLKKHVDALEKMKDSIESGDRDVY